MDPKTNTTSYSGFGTFIKAMEEFSVFKNLSDKFGMQKRAKKYNEYDYFYSLIVNLATGGKVINDVMRFKYDKVFGKAFNFSKGFPQSSAIYKFLSKADENSVSKFMLINKQVIRSILKKVYHKRKKVLRVLCFMDSSELEVQGKRFEGASKNYNGDMALRVHAIFLENFLISFRLYSTKSRYVTFGWKDLIDDLKDVSDIVKTDEIHLMMDSAYFNYDIFKRLEKEGWYYSVTLKKYEVFNDEANRLDEDRWEDDYSSFSYMSDKENKLYMVVVRREESKERDMFYKYNYHFVITNNQELSPKQIIKIHSLKMGMENRFKDLLIDLNLHHPRMSMLYANQLYYQIAMLVYNLIKSIQYLKLKGDDFFLSIRSFISKFILIPGKLIKRGGRLIFKLPYFPGGIKLLNRLIC